MSDSDTTPYSKQCEILGDLWLEYRDDEQFQDFFEYSDVGMPLAFAISEGLVKSTDKAERFVRESFTIFLSGLGLEDKGYEDLTEILEEADSKELGL
jgi:hypothetical protein